MEKFCGVNPRSATEKHLFDIHRLDYPECLMVWTNVTFGKHKGKSLPQVVFDDPDWFFWAREQGAFHGILRREADEVHRRATSIRVPQDDPDETLVAEYGMHHGRFCHLEVVPESRERHAGSTSTTRLPVFDMSFPRQVKGYDKLGYRILVRSLKFHLFRSERARLTRKRCEDFFDHDSNFVLD
jgi:hypothetical protein